MQNPTDPVLDRLTRLHPKLIDLTLDRVHRLLGRLANPHLSLPPVVHVAGTNGKGSVIAMLRAALEAADYTVHVHTSPHLMRFNERIRLAGKLIEDDALLALLEECEAENAGEAITFFEITTCAAMLAFSRTPADIVLLETGLGGRLDATNAIRDAAMTVITPVSIDHQQYLGETLAEIAAEKAGILKPGVPCVMAQQPPEARDVILEIAAELGAPLFLEGRDWSSAQELPRPNLPGPHQIRNAALAKAALDTLPGFEVDDAALKQGFGQIDWPARLQRLTGGRLAGLVRPDLDLWLDGGHNKAAGVTIRDWLDDQEPNPLHLVMGMLNTKNPQDFLAPFKDHITSLRTVTIPGEPASLSAEELASKAEGLGLSARPVSGVVPALREISLEESLPGRVLIAGSLYLAGKVLAENGTGGLQSSWQE